MNIPILSKLTGRKKTSLTSIIRSPLVTLLKKYADKNDYPFFENTPLYHRSDKIDIPLALFLPRAGLVLFEDKEWRYKELCNAKASKASHAQSSQNSLAFENIGDFIKEKFVDLSGHDDIVIFNFVIMEQLSEEEFDLLDESFHHLLPKERILFRDSTLEEIEEKFQKLQSKKRPYTVQNTLPFIFSQYTILDKEKIYFANKEQRAFIDKPLKNFETLCGDRQSGKSTSVIQKALLEKLEHPDKKITILTPTNLHADLLKQTLLELVEHSSVVLDMNAIVIHTPLELLELYKKRRDYSDVIFVDDALLMEEEFLSYIKQTQKERALLFVESQKDRTSLTFSHSYYGKIEFVKNREFPTLMKKLANLLKNDDKNDILIFASAHDFEDMKEDIESFTGIELSFVDTDKPLREQKLTRIKLCSHDEKNPLHGDYVFLMQSCQSDKNALEHLAKSSKTKSFILYEDECDTILELKNLLEKSNAKDKKE